MKNARVRKYAVDAADMVFVWTGRMFCLALILYTIAKLVLGFMED